MYLLKETDFLWSSNPNIFYKIILKNIEKVICDGKIVFYYTVLFDYIKTPSGFYYVFKKFQKHTTNSIFLKEELKKISTQKFFENFTIEFLNKKNKDLTKKCNATFTSEREFEKKYYHLFNSK